MYKLLNELPKNLRLKIFRALEMFNKIYKIFRIKGKLRANGTKQKF